MGCIASEISLTKDFLEVVCPLDSNLYTVLGLSLIPVYSVNYTAKLHNYCTWALSCSPLNKLGILSTE